jgi:tRNA threonylcarbamoyladenosine modification (KEOPS) complex  Pcc1 subunit
MGRYRAEFVVTFEDTITPCLIKEAITPDMAVAFAQRSTTAITSNKNILEVKINADDRTALKASFNSYFKLIALCCNIKEGFNE